MSQANAEKLASVYVKIRDKRRELAKQDDDLKEQLDLVSTELLKICAEQGATTIRTAYGTVSKRTTKKFWTSDWDSFYKFIKDHDAFALMQQRIHSKNMESFLDENPDLLPPGLNAEVNQTVTIVKR